MKYLKLLHSLVIVPAIITANLLAKEAYGRKNTITTAVSEQLNDNNNSTKRAVLIALIGTHLLQAISGNMGANTMIDYWLENYRWRGSGSSITQAMREPFDIAITSSDSARLCSMQVLINDSLDFTLKCEGKPYFHIPFNAHGMTLALSKNTSAYITLPKGLGVENAFINNHLYLLAQDQLSEQAVSFSDFTGVMADAVLLSVDLESKKIEMTLFYADCCDSATYIFQK